MPHSTHAPDSRAVKYYVNGVDLRPMTTTLHSKSADTVPNLVGTALTSHDVRTTLPSRSHGAWKQNSSQVVPEGFAELLRSGGNIDEGLAGRKAGDQSSVANRQPGDRSSIHSPYNNMDKRRSLYYEEQFQYKDNIMRQTQDRVQRESPVVAELRTNVIIKDEFSLVTDLSYHLAQRYTRPESCVMIKVDHSACLALGGTFDPCYIMTVTSVPSLMGPTTNKRNAALIQSFMADVLSVPAHRGIVKFQPVDESNFAMNGTTMLGEMERLEKNGAAQDGGNPVKRAITNASRKSIPSVKKSAPSVDTDISVSSSVPTTKGTTPVETKRRSSTFDSTLTTPFPDVFELPATDAERPSTAHGAYYAAGNGLRLNGISKDDVVGSATFTPNGRPKSFAGHPVSVLDQIKSEPMPKVPRQSSQQSQRPSQHIARAVRPDAEIKKGNIPNSPKPVHSTTPNIGTQKKSIAVSAATRVTDTYLDSVSTTQSTKEEKPDPKLDAKAAEKQRAADSKAKKDTEANTAKRRSNISATPKMPPPPPVPESKGGNEPKVWKRKSFLAAFRRSAAA